jgi:hypothetical protein
MMRKLLETVWCFFVKPPDFTKMTRQQRRDWYNSRW